MNKTINTNTTTENVKSVERIPTYALPYLVNGDATGLTDEDIEIIDKAVSRNGIEIVVPIAEDVEADPQPYFSSSPMFGLPAEVEDCIVIMRGQKDG